MAVNPSAYFLLFMLNFVCLLIVTLFSSKIIHLVKDPVVVQDTLVGVSTGMTSGSDGVNLNTIISYK